MSAIQETAEAEVLAVVREWALRNDKILTDLIRKMDIGVNEELYPSVKSKVFELAAAAVGMDLSFMTHGRFRDMGAGRGPGRQERDLTVAGIVAKVESQDTNGRILIRKRGKGGRFKKNKKELKGRKAAKWYSRAFYGRLNALSAVVSTKMVEAAVQAVQEVKTPN